MTGKSQGSAASPQGNLLKELLAKKAIVQIIAKALAETISGYTKTTVTAGQPFFKSKTNKGDIAVIGLICFEGPEVSLELCLGFSKGLFLSLYENMFHMPVDEISPDNHDLAGELLNIAFGMMDPKFRKMGYRLISSFPKIYSGEDLTKIQEKIEAEAVVIPYTANGKEFVVEVYAAGSLGEQWQFDPGVKDSA